MNPSMLVINDASPLVKAARSRPPADGILGHRPLEAPADPRLRHARRAPSSSYPPANDRSERRRLPVKSGLEIAQEAELRPITEIASSAGIPDDVLEPFGRYRAKGDLSILDRLADRPDGKLVITTAITPTKAGEGKTTTSISLTQ